MLWSKRKKSEPNKDVRDLQSAIGAGFQIMDWRRYQSFAPDQVDIMRLSDSARVTVPIEKDLLPFAHDEIAAFIVLEAFRERDVKDTLEQHRMIDEGCPSCESEKNRFYRGLVDHVAAAKGPGIETSFIPLSAEKAKAWDQKIFEAYMQAAKEKPMTKPTPEHTDLPWTKSVTRKNERTIEIDITDGRVKICTVVGSINPLIDSIAGAGQAHGNARLIAKSVNNHHRLTDALQNLLQAATPERIKEAADALEAVDVMPILPGHCPDCGEMPCGQYMGCPPASTRADRLKQLEAQRDAYLMEDVLAEMDDVRASRPKPDSQEWVDGLPPAGVECEVWFNSAGAGYWEKGLVIAHDDDRIVVRVGTEYYGRKDRNLIRPIRTKEQREREEVIAGALNVALHPADDEIHPRQYLIDCLHALYGAGLLRKGGE